MLVALFACYLKESQGEILLGDLMSVLIMYLEKSPDWEINGRRYRFNHIFYCNLFTF